MADNKNSANVLVCESQEVLYKKAVKKMNADKLIIQYAYKIENYRTAAAMFDEVGAYLDSKELAQKCRDLAEETEAEAREEQYQKAKKAKEKAAAQQELEKAAQQFEELGSYKDSASQRQECLAQIAIYDKKIKGKALGIGAVVILCIGVLVAGYTTGFYRYVMGVFYSSMGYYEKSEPIFEELGDFLDSQERARVSREEQVRRQETEELSALQKAKAGDSVVFGAYTWKVLERSEDQLYLILQDVKGNGPFSQVSYHETQEAVDWENSSLRSWLNGEVLETEFAPEDRQALLPMGEEGAFQEDADSQVQDGGLADGKDYVSVLSVAEMQKYKKVVSGLKGADYWLKDAGAEPDTAVFVSASGQVMEHGYPVAEAEFSLRPVILVDCLALTEEEHS